MCIALAQKPTLLLESFVDIDCQFDRAVRIGRFRPAAFQDLIWSTIGTILSGCFVMPREARCMIRRHFALIWPLTHRRNDRGTTINIRIGVRKRAARRNCHGKSCKKGFGYYLIFEIYSVMKSNSSVQRLTFDNLAALLPAAIAMQSTTKKIKPSPFAMKTSMLV